MLGIMNDAISMVKLHVESFHKRYLPFGITNDEARMLIKEEYEPKIFKGNIISVQTKPNYTFRNTTPTLQSLLDKLLGEDIEAERKRTEKEEAQSIA